MEALIMSCGTGGGHNTAAQAVADELKRHGHGVTFMDPYNLVGESTAATIGNAYIKMVQKSPKMFGIVYSLGDAYRQLPVHSPVYWANGKMKSRMQSFLEGHNFDVVVMSHVFPAHIMTNLKRDGFAIPITVLIATDYTCIPFMEEADCDYYVVPSENLCDEFCARGISREKLLPFGIPARKEFTDTASKAELKSKLGLEADKKYILLCGGSIGAGDIEKSAKAVQTYLQDNPDYALIIICGNNQKLYKTIKMKYGRYPQISVMQSTSQMADYMKVCDVFISKPGGLSSTEAAVSNVPLIHISPIPGCESRNADFFEKRGMSIYVQNPKTELYAALEKIQGEGFAEQMKNAQRRYINREATSNLCDFLYNVCEK